MTYIMTDSTRILSLLDVAQDGDTVVVYNAHQQAMLESAAIGRGLEIIVQVIDRRRDGLPQGQGGF